MVVLFLFFVLLGLRVEASYLDARYKNKYSNEFIQIPANSRLQISADLSASHDSGFAARSKERPLSEATGISTGYPFRIYWKPFMGKNIWLGFEGTGSERNQNHIERPIYVKNVIRDWRILDQSRQRSEYAASIFFPVPLGVLLGFEARQEKVNQQTVFYQLNSSGESMWRFEENLVLSRSSYRFSALKEMYRDWLLNLDFHSKALLSPSAWGLGLGRRQERRLLSAHVLWVNYSEIKNRSLFDQKDLQFLAAGNKEPVSPGFHDVVGLRFDMQSPISKNVDLSVGAQFDGHPIERKLITPKVSLGAGVKLMGGFYLKPEVCFSYRDYFGDGIFWATDQRVAETKWAFKQELKWSF